MKVLKRTVHFDGMCWPRYLEDEDDSVQWRLRYGPRPVSEEDLMHAASVMQAYTALIGKPHHARLAIIRTLKAAEHSPNAPESGEKK